MTYKFRRNVLIERFDLSDIFTIELNYRQYNGLQINIVSKLHTIINELDENKHKKTDNIDDIILEITKTLYEYCHKYDNPKESTEKSTEKILSLQSTIKRYYEILCKILKDFAEKYDLVELPQDGKI